jgi:hypothetical protein
MPATYNAIATTTISSPTPTITFSGIPNTFTDLFITLHGRSGGSSIFSLRFNSDTGANYSWVGLNGTGSSANCVNANNATFLRLDNAGSVYSQQPLFGTINVMSYANTSAWKTALTTLSQSMNTASNVIEFTTGNWRSTSAISTVTLSNVVDNWEPGTIATVYGILRA